MSVIRVIKNKNYTVMSNHHLQDKQLSFKAKGLLSMCLSLPNNWDYSISGLVEISKEGKACVMSTLKELEVAGYLSRKQKRNEQGRIVDVEYTIVENPDAEIPDMVNTDKDNPDIETPIELNTNKANINKQMTNPIGSERNSGNESDTYAGQKATDNWREIKERVEKQIDYTCLIHDYPMLSGEIDEFVMIVSESLCSSKPTLRVNGEEMPAAMVKDRLKMLRYDHIRYALHSLHNTTTQTKKPNQYLLTVLYNAPATINHYYNAEANHDMYGYPD